MTDLFNSSDAVRFSRRWWVELARTFLLVSMVTVLIWVYADLEFTDTQELRATILLTTESNRNLVVLSKRDVEIALTLRGNRSALDSFQRRLSAQGALITCDLAKTHDEGRHALATLDILRSAPGINELGLSVVATSPGVINVHVDRQVVKTVPIEFIYSNANLVEPPKLSTEVAVAESRWKDILAAQPNPTLKTVNRDLANEPSGKPIEIEAEIVPFLGDVRVEPAAKMVRFTVEVSQRTDTKTLSVPVRVLAPPEWQDVWRQYDLVRKDPLEWRPKIIVTGPKKDLEQLTPDGVNAFVALAESDKDPVSWLERDVQFQFPKALSIQLVGEKPKVRFKLQERPPTPTP